MRVTSASEGKMHEFNDMADLSGFHEHIKVSHMSPFRGMLGWG